jgi:hypothetical protein
VGAAPAGVVKDEEIDPREIATTRILVMRLTPTGAFRRGFDVVLRKQDNAWTFYKAVSLKIID